MSYSFPLPERNVSASAAMMYAVFNTAIDHDESNNISCYGIAFKHDSFIQHRDRWTVVFHFDGQFVLPTKEFNLRHWKVVDEYRVRTYGHDDDKLLVQDVIAFCVEHSIRMDFSQHLIPDPQVDELISFLNRD